LLSLSSLPLPTASLPQIVPSMLTYIFSLHLVSVDEGKYAIFVVLRLSYFS
jgi:hypothetical protein